MNTVIIYRYWRAPYPSANWCPRMVLAYLLDTMEFIYIPNGQDKSKQQLSDYVMNHLGDKYSGFELIDNLPEVEISKGQFRAFNERFSK